MRFSFWIAVLGAVVATSLPSTAPAHEEVFGKIRIGHPWVQAAEAGAAGTYGCIIEIKNEGDIPERLLGATLDGAGPGTLYEIIETDGKLTSRKVEGGLAIKPRGSLELTPVTYQIRFGKVGKALVQGEMIEGTLVFDKLRSVPINFMIEQNDAAPKEEGAPKS
jgi:copper(I)-binding protein